MARAVRSRSIRYEAGDEGNEKRAVMLLAPDEAELFFKLHRSLILFQRVARFRPRPVACY